MLNPIVPSPTPTAILRTFTRACGHTTAQIHTPGDAAQAARYEATACAGCRPESPKFGRGRGSSR